VINKLAVPGYRVAPMYNDEPNGTIIGRCDDGLNVFVAWDSPTQKFQFGIDDVTKATSVREQIKYLRKGI